MLNGMFNTSALMNNFFRKVDNAVWDLQTGRLGFVSQDGIHTLSGEGEDASVELNIIQQFGIPLPAFARSTPIEGVKIGDMIHGNVKGWVVAIKNDAEGNVNSFKIMKISGEITPWKPPHIKMLGLDSGVMVVTSLINLAPGGQGGLANLQSSLLPLMMLGGGNVDLDSLMPLLLVSGGFGNSNDASATAGLGGIVQNFMMLSMLKGGQQNQGGMFGNLLGSLGGIANQGGQSGQGSAGFFNGRRGA